MNKAILLPMLVLAGWTMIVWIWMYATRIPAMGRAGIDGAKMVGATGKSLRDDLTAAGEHRASWVADNYNHLMEQPTIFYATALALAVMGEGGSMAVNLAWGYAGLRIVHSLVQILSNRVIVRFLVFALASLCLLGLVLLALSIASAQA
ncbi:MAPEG family protein [Sandarakinorhabdus limnophila]|uniref:MAPEG family protein n=1 Tax=Sandarakinorhabdus limnophila TaxID=210512 RepID=UPI0026ED08CF|nr:MAPEG family protein [Sandarakinorhabdus limnophila]MCM0032037.1 MAPEG family protein [Sandarakinorhabdus limnophila]